VKLEIHHRQWGYLFGHIVLVLADSRPFGRKRTNFYSIIGVEYEKKALSLQRVSKDTIRPIWGLFALSLSPYVCCDSDEGRESETPAIADIVTNIEANEKKNKES